MLRLSGERLGCLPIPSLKWVEDLEYCDGPLVSHFTNGRGGDFLRYWVDVEDNITRWMIVRVSENDIIRLANRVESLDMVLPVKCQDDFVYFVDSNNSGDQVVRLVYLGKIPDAYTPDKESFLRPPELVNERSFPVFIDADLEKGDLGSIPRAFTQAYEVLYILSTEQAEKFISHPWRDGFSSMHFYNELISHMPEDARVRLTKVQYASPGFIRFSLHRPTAEFVSTCVLRAGDPDSAVSRAFTAIGSYIDEHGLNRLKREDAAWSKHNPKLLSGARQLLDALDLQNASALIRAAPRPFEAAKIARSIVRRLRTLASYQKQGTIRLPRE